MYRLNLQASTAGAAQPSKGNTARNVKAKAATVERTLPAVRQPRPENVEGSFYVDHTCIDCDKCRFMAPKSFTREDEQSAVTRQPENDAERLQAYQALLSCPTYSIHCTDKQPGELKEAVDSFPIPMYGSQHAYNLGFASEASYGATPYLLVREGGNVLVDSPRYDVKLLKRIQALGGAKYMFLTHRDDVADHMKWASALNCDRIIHELEANDRQQTSQCEVKLTGDGPWTLPDGGDDVSLILTPGHTRGSVVLYFHPEKILFSGDHLMFRANGQLSMARYHNWYSIEEQLKSVAKCGELELSMILAGHGRPGAFENDEHQREAFDDIIAREGR